MPYNYQRRGFADMRSRKRKRHAYADFFYLCGGCCNFVARHSADKIACGWAWSLVLAAATSITMLGLLGGLLYKMGSEGGQPSNAFVAYFAVVLIGTALSLIVIWVYLFKPNLSWKRRIFLIVLVVWTYAGVLLIGIIFFARVGYALRCNAIDTHYAPMNIPVTVFTTQVFGVNFENKPGQPIANLGGIQKMTCMEVEALWILAMFLAFFLLVPSIKMYIEVCPAVCGDDKKKAKRKRRERRREKKEEEDDEEKGIKTVGEDDVIGEEGEKEKK